MNRRCLSFVAAVAALVPLTQGQVTPPEVFAKAKAAKQTWTPPRAADGRADISGFWSNNSATPLERPKEFGGRASLTDQELAAFKKKAAELFDGNGNAVTPIRETPEFRRERERQKLDARVGGLAEKETELAHARCEN